MHRMSRREFMELVMLATGGTVVTACGTRVSPTPEEKIELPSPTPAPTVAIQMPTKAPPTPTRAPEAPTPTPSPTPEPVDENAFKYGGTWRASVMSDVPSLDGPSCGWIDWWLAHSCIYSRLYDFDLEGKPVLGLAEDFPDVSDDGLTYVFKIKKGVKFHDGSLLTAEDVKFTIDRHYSSQGSAVSCCGGHLSPIKGVKDVRAVTPAPDFVDLEGTKVLDDFTLQIDVETPMSVLPFVLAIHCGNVVPKKAVEEAKEDWGTKVVIGCGPFKLKEWRPGELVVLERNPDYFKPGLPYLDEMEVYLNLDYQASLLRFESREIEYLLGPDAEDAKRLMDDPVFKNDVVFGEYPGWISYVDLALNTPPFDDIRMRQAVAMAIDREALSATSGGATIAWDQLYTPRILQYDPDFKLAYPFDPDKAKAIVEELYPNGVTIQFWPGGIGATLGQIIQEDLRKVGIDVQLVEGELGVLKDRLASGEIQMICWGWANDYPDGMNLMQDRFACDPDDATRWMRKGDCDAQINAWFAEILRLPITDPVRTDLLRKVQNRLLNETVTTVVVRHIRVLDLYAQYVKDIGSGSATMLPWVEEAWIDQAEYEKLKDIRPQAS